MPSLIGGLPNQVPTNADLGTMAFQDKEAVNIEGGVINNTPIGGSTPAAGAFTNLTATGVGITSGSSGAGITFGTYNKLFSSYSSGALVLGSNVLPSLSADSYLVGLTGNYGASAIRCDWSSGGSIRLFADAPASKTAGAAFTPTERARITSTGNLLVGTTTDDGVNKLQVNGGISSTGLSVTGSIKGSTTIGVGNATPATSGAGITFPATQSASSDANTLDDYEEGTWTPVLGGATSETGQSYDLQSGTYTKVGNKVFCEVRIVMTNKGTITGGVTLKGLPFVVSNGNPHQAPSYISVFAGMATSWVTLSAVCNIGETTAYIIGSTAAATANNITVVSTDITNTTSVIFQFNYTV